jgi:type II secretory pathway component PulM
MANWLDKALGRQQAGAAVEAVPFELVCDCGQRLTGVRSERGRRIICKECGRAQFVLPLNSYPVATRQLFSSTQVEEPEAEDQDQLRVADDGPEDDFGDDIVDEAFGKPATAKARNKAASKKTSAPGRRTPIGIETLEPQRTPRPSSHRQLLIVFGVFMLVAVVMLLWGIASHRREQAERIFKDSGESGLAAFSAGDFAKAERELNEAVAAADRLGLNEVQSGTVRSRRAHAEAAVRMLDIDLFELVTNADRMASQQWHELFKSQYRDKWVVMSAPAELSTITQDGEERITFDLKSSQPKIRLTGMDHLASVLKGSLAKQEVLFAGCLEDCRKLDDGWVIALKPKSAVLWQDLVSLRRMGLFAEEDEAATTLFRSLIERQTGALQTPAKTSSTTEKAPE